MHIWAAVVAGFVGWVVGFFVGRRIETRSFLVPVVTAVLFGILALRFGLDPVLPAYLYLAAVSVALAAIDIDRQRLPNALTLPSYVVGLALLGAAVPFVEDGLRHLASAVAGMVGLWLLYALLFFIHPRGMGWGDVKLAGVLGLYLGWLGFGAWAVGALLAFLLGAAYGLTLVILRRATRKTPLPFGPFMIAGTMLAVLAGGQLARYLGVLPGSAPARAADVGRSSYVALADGWGIPRARPRRDP